MSHLYGVQFINKSVKYFTFCFCQQKKTQFLQLFNDTDKTCLKIIFHRQICFFGTFSSQTTLRSYWKIVHHKNVSLVTNES